MKGTAWSLVRSHWRVYAGAAITAVLGSLILSVCLSNLVAATMGDGVNSNTVSDAEALYFAEIGLENTASFMLTTLLISAATTAILIFSTIAYATDQCASEFSLMRLVGASKRQMRRVVLWQVCFIGALGGFVGSISGVAIAPLFVRVLAELDLAPVEFSPVFRPWVMAIATAATLLCTLVGGLIPANRVAKTSPLRALSESQTSTRSIGKPRIILGIVGLSLSLMLLFSPLSWGDFQTLTVGIGLLAIISMAALAPFLVPMGARVLGAVFGMGGSIVWVIAKEHAAWSARRTAAIATPIVLLVGIAGSFFMIAQSSLSLQRVDFGDALLADVIVEPREKDGILTDEVVAEISAIPNVESAVIADFASAWQLETDKIPQQEALVAKADLALLARAIDIKVVRGELSSVSDTVVATTNEELEPGETVKLTLPDGQHESVTIGAVVKENEFLVQDVILSPTAPQVLTPAPDQRRMWLIPEPGTDPPTLVAEVNATVVDTTAKTKTEWIDQGTADRKSEQFAGLMTLLVAPSLLALFSLVQTAIVNKRDRNHEYWTMAANGATRRQLKAIALAEVALISSVAVIMVSVTQASTAIRLALMLKHMEAPVGPVIPWTVLLLLTGVCVIATIVASTTRINPLDARHRTRQRSAR